MTFGPRVGGSSFFSVTFTLLLPLSVFLIGSMYSVNLPDCPPRPELCVERLCLAGSRHKGTRSRGSLLIATVPDTKGVMGDLSGGDAVSRAGPLYLPAAAMLFSVFILPPVIPGDESGSWIFFQMACLIAPEPSLFKEDHSPLSRFSRSRLSRVPSRKLLAAASASPSAPGGRHLKPTPQVSFPVPFSP